MKRTTLTMLVGWLAFRCWAVASDMALDSWRPFHPGQTIANVAYGNGVFVGCYEYGSLASADGRAGVFYDEFVGQLPRSALGWVLVTANGGTVTAVDGEADRPGLVKVSTGTSAAGMAMLRYASDTVILGGDRRHIIELMVKRERTAFAPDNYECRFGLLSTLPGSDQGVYFAVDQGTNNYIRAKCVDDNGECLIGQYQNDFNVDWRRLRLEVAPDRSEVVFFCDGVNLGTAQSNVPTCLLVCAARITRLSVSIVGEQFFRMDYFQHIVL